MRCLLVLAVALGLGTPSLAAEHPGAASPCGDCHTVGRGSDAAPKVIPQAPGFFAKLFGEKSLRGHPTVSCVGQRGVDGTVTGCHAPGNGRSGFLVGESEGRPVDELCGACHPRVRKPGAHHPSYRTDKDQDGVAESVVRPAAGQEVYTVFSTTGKAQPLLGYPDAIVFKTAADGRQELDVVLPLQRVVETVDGAEIVEADLVTCTTCHNPHYGYLVEVSTEEDLDQEQVARENGDALLRLRDHDNALCEACH